MKNKEDRIYDNIKTAFDYQDVDKWKDNYKKVVLYLKGDYPDKNQYHVWTHYNLLNLIIPNLYYRDPYIRLKPRREFVYIPKEDGEYEQVNNVQSADLLESILNKILPKINFKIETRKVIQDTLLGGFGVLKSGYSFETISEENNEYIKEDEVFCMRVPILDFGYDPLSTSLEDSRFCIHRITKPLELVKKRYKVSDLQGEIADTTKKEKKELSKEGADFVTLYEVEDNEENKVYLCTKDKKRILEKKDKPYDFNGSQYSMMKFSGDNEEFRGIPMLQTINDQALSINKIQTLMIHHLEIFPGQILYEHGALDEDEADAIMNGEQGSLLQVTNGALREGRIRKENPLQMGAEYYSTINLLQGIIDKQLGIPDFQRSLSTKRKTATEVTYEESDSSVRREFFLDCVKTCVLNATEKLTALMQQNYDREREIAIEGDVGFEFRKFTKKDIQGEFDFDFEIDSLRIVQQSKFNQIMNALNVVGAHAQNIPAFAEMLKDMDGKKLGKELWKTIGLNYESFKKPDMSHMEHDPYWENEQVDKGQRLEDRYSYENHNMHTNVHKYEFERLRLLNLTDKAQEIMRHMQMHDMMGQGAGVNQQPLPQQPGQPVPNAMQTPAPSEMMTGNVSPMEVK